MQALGNNKYCGKRYLVQIHPEKIERSWLTAVCISEGKTLALLRFYKIAAATNVLVTLGSGGHACVFAELGLLLLLQGFKVFRLPQHGGFTITELLKGYEDAVQYITSSDPVMLLTA